MLYDYECSECKYFMEDVYQSIKDDALTKCPQCKNETLERIITGGIYGHVYQEPTTIGQQADRNWKNKGHYEKSNIEAKADKKAREKRESRKMINRMNKEHQYHYIMTGEQRQ
jgi:putative FmdB family regulatory protein